MARKDPFFERTFNAFTRHGLTTKEANTLAREGIRASSPLGRSVIRHREGLISRIQQREGLTRIGAVRKATESLSGKLAGGQRATSRGEQFLIDRIMRLGRLGKRSQLTPAQWQTFRKLYQPSSKAA